MGKVNAKRRRPRSKKIFRRKKQGMNKRNQVVRSNVSKTGEWTLIVHPLNNMRSPVPDKWYTDHTFDTFFSCAIGDLSGAGNKTGNYGCISLNSLIGPFSNVISNTNAILVNAAGGAAGVGLSGAFGAGYAIGDNAYNTTIFSTIYQRRIVLSGELKVEISCQSGSDMAEVTLVPLETGYIIPNTTIGHAAPNMKRAKSAFIQAYGAQTLAKILVSRATVAELVGLGRANANELIAKGGLDTNSGGGIPTTNVGWLLCINMTDQTSASVGNVSVRCRLKQRVLWYSANSLYA